MANRYLGLWLAFQQLSIWFLSAVNPMVSFLHNMVLDKVIRFLLSCLFSVLKDLLTCSIKPQTMVLCKVSSSLMMGLLFIICFFVEDSLFVFKADLSQCHAFQEIFNKYEEPT